MNETSAPEPASPPAPAAGLFGLGRIRALAGYRFGRRQRLVAADVMIDRDRRGRRIADLAHALVLPHVPATPFTDPDATLPGESDAEASLRRVAAIAAGLQEAAGSPVLEPPQLDVPPGGGPRDGLLACPTFDPAVGLPALRWAVDHVKRVARGELTEADGANVGEAIAAFAEKLKPYAPAGVNTPPFLRAAHALDIPCITLPATIVQYGYGGGARLLASSLTEKTSALGAQLASNKRATNAMLRHAGFPVAPQRVTSSLIEARTIAREIGYPVVLKAPSLERGLGVTADIINEQELTAAFKRLREASAVLLLERHVPGDVWRVNVVEGEIFRIVGKTAAHVTGDGTRTLRALIEEENRAPDRNGPDRQLNPIRFDEHLEERLAARGMSLDTVLPAGESFRLRGEVHTASGGRILPTDPEIHPETARMCVKIATYLGVDLAGIDIVTTDLARPLSETGGIFCEVNVAPQIVDGPDFFLGLMPRLLPGGAGMPLACWLTTEPDPALPEGLGAVPQAGTMPALLDRARPRATLVGDGAPFAREGLPVDRLHALAVGRWTGSSEALAAALSVAGEALRGPVLAEAGHPHLGAIRAAAGPHPLWLGETRRDVEERLAELLSSVPGR